MPGILRKVTAGPVYEKVCTDILALPYNMSEQIKSESENGGI
jgi:hypothetical protein